jgi:toxin ParE1/3/4
VKPVILSVRADADVAEIRVEGDRQWGVERNDRYVDDLRKRFRIIGANPERYPLVGASRPAIRRVKSGRHIIFYREEAERVLIVRILHERTEYRQRL